MPTRFAIRCTVLSFSLVCSFVGLASWVNLAVDGKPQVCIVQQEGLTEPEQNALEELRLTLAQIIGNSIQVLPIDQIDRNLVRIYVGAGAQARKEFSGIRWEQLGPEEILVLVQSDKILLAGGRPRGTLYAVSTFLERWCGVRWWTPWASHIPSQPNLGVPTLVYRYSPVFEYREPFWYCAFDPKWAVRNRVNGQAFNIPDEWGGCVRYRGFVHTFYALVPPEEWFEKRPEWFSMINGRRTGQRAQLCLTNPELREFVTKRVRQWLEESPSANIVSISQNDWYGACECPSCRAIDEREGSPAGSLLDFVNYIAGRLEREFPNVAFDTLAYQYTRKPPRTIRPRDNVIVRLCSIECSFRQPLDSKENESFLHDLEGWSKICSRLYIWDYTTNFRNYLQPHPNWYVLGPNIRIFARSNVKGVFEQGAYQSYGSEFGELRAWVLAQLLWDPSQDDLALIHEFLTGYYGPAAPLIESYMKLMWESSKGYYLRCFTPENAPFLDFKTLEQAERLWQKAELMVRGDEELEARVRLGRVWLGSVWLQRWDQLRSECEQMGAKWPLPADRSEYARQWLALAHGDEKRPWTRITLVREWGGITPEKFVEPFLKKQQN